MIFRRSARVVGCRHEELEPRRLLSAEPFSETDHFETATSTTVRLDTFAVAAETRRGTSQDDLSNTFESDDIYQEIVESDGIARLDYDWLFEVPAGQPIDLEIEAFTTGDEPFWVSYSVDGGNHFQTFLTLTQDTDDGTISRFDIPASDDGDLVIRIRDSVASGADAVSSVFVDRITVVTEHAVASAPSSDAPVSVGSSSFPNGATVTIIGDSISSGINETDADNRGYPARPSYRPQLWDLIQSSGLSNDVRFAGSSNYNSSGLPAEAVAHSSYRGFATYSFLPFDKNPYIGSDPDGSTNGSNLNADGWATFDADIAIIMVGANDVLEGRSPDRSRETVEDIIDELRDDNGNVTIVVGTVLPFGSSRINAHKVADFNTMLKDLVYADDGWAGSTNQSPIYIVDHHAGLPGLPRYDADVHSADGIHPNALGDALLADNLWSVLRPLLSGSGVSRATTQQSSVDTVDVQEELELTKDVVLDIDRQIDVIEGGGDVTFSIRIRGDKVYHHPINVYYSTIEGTARAGSDFVAESDFTGETLKKIVIPAYTNRVTAKIAVLSDSRAEPEEDFTIRLRAAAPQDGVGPRDVAIGRADATVYIHDDDAAEPSLPTAEPETELVFVDLLDAVVNESQREAKFDIAIQDGKTFFHSMYVYFSTSDRSAIAGKDYVGKTTSRVLIPAGVNRVTATVDLLPDNLREGTESFEVKLVAAAATDGVAPGAVKVGRPTATITINDND